MEGNKKRVFILVLVGLLGLSIEAIKSFKPVAHDNSHISASDIGKMDLNPFHRSAGDDSFSNNPQSRRGLRQGKVTALGKKIGTQNDSHTFAGGHAKTKRGQKKKLAEKDKDKKKKKKKKKKDDKKVATKNTPPKKYIIKDKEEETSAFDNGYSQTVSTTTEDPSQKNDELLTTLEEWVEFVLNQPNMTKTTKFIKFYQTSLISDQIFYGVLAEMMADPRKIVTDFAIIAAGSTPSYRSFVTLIEIMEKEPHGSPLRIKAESKMANYQAIDQLQALRLVLTDPAATSVALKFAAKSLEKSTKMWLEDVQNPNPAPLDELGRPTHPNSNYFISFVGIIETILNTNSSDIELRDSLQSAYNRIKDITT